MVFASQDQRKTPKDRGDDARSCEGPRTSVQYSTATGQFQPQKLVTDPVEVEALLAEERLLDRRVRGRSQDTPGSASLHTEPGEKKQP
jgi:hypothetical protein